MIRCDRHPGIQGGVGILEDHLQLPAQGLEPAAGQGQQVDNLILFGAEPGRSGRRLVASEKSPGQRGLSATALSHE